jgi:hypothetical protein
VAELSPENKIMRSEIKRLVLLGLNRPGF